MPIENRFIHTVIAITPVLLSPLWVLILAEGWVDVGGGEKDILLAIPYFILTLTFFVCAIVLIIKRWPLLRWIKRASAVALTILLCLGLVAFATSWLGVS